MGTTDRELPFRLGRYRLIEALGKGAQGAVYLGELEAELGFRRRVAVKIVQEGSSSAGHAIKSLANEARVLAAAHHPNVVMVYDLVRIEGEYMLVMEYVEGPTLSFAIRQLALQDQTLSVGEALLIGEQMADGLTCVHGLRDHLGEPAPIVHRDLKPSNVILSRRGQIKLVDFGLAKGKLVAFHTVVPNITRGTPGYMSPEQVVGEALTPASDQFALGAILFEMVTSLPLYSDRSEQDLMKRVVEGRPSSDPQMLRRACPELFPLVTRCLSLDATQRFASTAELASALREVRQRLGQDPDLRALVERIEDHHDEPAGGPAPPGKGTERFVFGDRDTAPELDPLFAARGAADPVPPADADQPVARKFRDMMTHDVSFHDALPKGRQMSFSKPKTEGFGPSQFDLDPVVADDPEERDSDDDTGPPAPWELDD